MRTTARFWRRRHRRAIGTAVSPPSLAGQQAPPRRTLESSQTAAASLVVQPRVRRNRATDNPPTPPGGGQKARNGGRDETRQRLARHCRRLSEEPRLATVDDARHRQPTRSRTGDPAVGSTQSPPGRSPLGHDQEVDAPPPGLHPGVDPGAGRAHGDLRGAAQPLLTEVAQRLTIEQGTLLESSRLISPP